MHFSTWDLAGQEVYYATHQCFLSRNTLYLAVWNMEGGEKEIKALRPWLLNIRVSSKPVLCIASSSSDSLNSILWGALSVVSNVTNNGTSGMLWGFYLH